MNLTKFVFVLATLSLCLASSYKSHRDSDSDTRYAYKHVKPLFIILEDNEVTHNRLVNSLLNFASIQVLTQACGEQGLFLASDFVIGEIFEVSRWADKSKAIYKFHVRHNHAHRNELYIESRFFVEYKLGCSLSLAERAVVSFFDFNIKFDECATEVSSYKVYSKSHHHDSNILEWLGYGNGYICQQARRRNQLLRLPTSVNALDVLTIHEVSYRGFDGITYYKYDVLFADSTRKSYNVEATFIVMRCDKSHKYSIVAIEYIVNDLVRKHHCNQDDYRVYSSDSSNDESSDCSDENCLVKGYKNSDCSDKNSDCSDKRH